MEGVPVCVMVLEFVWVPDCVIVLDAVLDAVLEVVCVCVALNNSGLFVGVIVLEDVCVIVVVREIVCDIVCVIVGVGDVDIKIHTVSDVMVHAAVCI